MRSQMGLIVLVLLIASPFLWPGSVRSNGADKCCASQILKPGNQMIAQENKKISTSKAQVLTTQPSPARALIPANERGLRPLAKPFSVTGEVVDSWCYASQVMGGGRGEAHKPCALACGHGGVTLGIVDDQGTLYVAVKSRAYNGCNQLLLPFVAKRVKATGWLATKGGSNIMKIQTVELAK